jgi:hypothetical protein
MKTEATRKFIGYFLVIFCFFFVFLVSFIFFLVLEFWAFDSLPISWSDQTSLKIFKLTTVLAPVVSLAASFKLSSFLNKWYAENQLEGYPVFNKILFLENLSYFKKIFITCYFITWAFGIPAVNTMNTKTAINSYKAIYKTTDNNFPSIRGNFAIPLLPGVILMSHSYTLAGLNGWGGISLFCWYIVGENKIISIPFWVS